MILGLGNDLVDIRRIEAMLARHGARFKTRIFTAQEQETADKKVNPAASYAKRFAAKEACVKALGTGFQQGILWADIGVQNNDMGQPLLTLKGGAARALQNMLPELCTAKIHLSMSDDYPYAQAFVIIEALPL